MDGPTKKIMDITPNPAPKKEPIAIRIAPIDSQPENAVPVSAGNVPEAPVAPAPPTPNSENIPHFGELQPKIDAHPLFSGAKEPRPHHSGLLRKTLWPVVSLLIVIILLYLAIDSGLIKTNVNMPFHVFKQPVASTAPTITQPAAVPAAAAPVANDPYAGWKTYCDVFGTNGCFKYPADWTLTSGSSINTQVQNASDTVHVVYDANYNCSCSAQNFYTASIDSPSTANSSVQIVGGYFTTSNSPIYYLVDSAEVQKYALAATKISPNVATLSVTNGTKQVSLAAYNAKLTTPIKTADANSWFTSSDGATALLVMKSFYFKQ